MSAHVSSVSTNNIELISYHVLDALYTAARGMRALQADGQEEKKIDRFEIGEID